MTEAGAAGDEAVRAASFDALGADYDAHRPGYPEVALDAMLAGTGSQAAVIELGAGTGKASVPLAARGARLLATEPGPALVAILTARLAPYPNASVLCSRFEQLEVPAPWRPADAVVAASAWHWVDNARGLRLAAGMLRPGGRLAACWNVPIAFDPPLRPALDACIARIAPELAGRSLFTGADPARFRLGDTVGFGFASPVHVSFGFALTYSPERFVAMLGTHSAHALLDRARRRDLDAALSEVVELAGGEVEVRFSCEVVSATRREGA